MKSPTCAKCQGWLIKRTELTSDGLVGFLFCCLCGHRMYRKQGGQCRVIPENMAPAIRGYGSI
jgi:hypothetical protein